MKYPIVVSLAFIVPPLATVLCWIDIVYRADLPNPLRGWWAVVSVIPVLGPLMYLGLGGGQFTWTMPRSWV